MPYDGGQIRSVRFRHPNEDRDIRVTFVSEDYSEVDAVFTSVNAVTRILIPFYEDWKPKVAAMLREEVKAQQLDGVCLVLHKYVCRRAVPPIDWNAKSIRL
jgi:hypothetical protein